MPTKPKKPPIRNLYSVHPSVQMVQKWVKELPSKTGRSLEEWIRHVRRNGPKTEKERRDWLKKGCGLGTNSAWWIAERAEGKGEEDPDPEAYLRAAVQYVEQMYSGSKAGLRPLHDALVELARSTFKDIRICPCQTIVPLYRNHVIAEIKPATRTRIDFGLALGETPATGRLIDTGGLAKKNRITHRIPITAIEEIDAEVKRWLKSAYDRDA
jgi:hypothetical protein